MTDFYFVHEETSGAVKSFSEIWERCVVSEGLMLWMPGFRQSQLV
jgi:hypothetical protein